MPSTKVLVLYVLIALMSAGALVLVSLQKDPVDVQMSLGACVLTFLSTVAYFWAGLPAPFSSSTTLNYA